MTLLPPQMPGRDHTGVSATRESRGRRVHGGGGGDDCGASPSRSRSSGWTAPMAQSRSYSASVRRVGARCRRAWSCGPRRIRWEGGARLAVALRITGWHATAQNIGQDNAGYCSVDTGKPTMSVDFPGCCTAGMRTCNAGKRVFIFPILAPGALVYGARQAEVSVGVAVSSHRVDWRVVWQRK